MKKRILIWIVSLLGIKGFLIIFFSTFLLIVIIGASASSTSYSNSTSGLYSCSPTGQIDEARWNEVFSRAGKLAGTQDIIISLSREKGIDPVLFAAIAFHETGYGTSYAIVHKNNPGGLMDPKTGSRQLYEFATLKDGLRAMANTLHNRIIKDGLVTLEALGSVYAPIGAANDPNNLNQHWVPNVRKIANELGGLTMNCEAIEHVEIIGDKAWPVPFTKNITSGFGFRTITVNGRVQSRMHKGIDIASAGVLGKPIVAYMDGVVVQSNYAGGFGNLVVIDHGNGIQTYYAHMVERGVPVGTQVRAGDFIGKVGSTGNSTGPHLHFELHINGQAVDPMPYLQELLSNK